MDKLAEPLARPPILDWEPLPTPGSNAEIAAEARGEAEKPMPGREALEPTGSLAGRNPNVTPQLLPPPAPARGPEQLARAVSRAVEQPEPLHRPSPPPSPQEPVEEPQAPTALSPPSVPPAAPALAVELPALPPSPLPEVTLQIAPIESASAAPTRIQACPPPGRDGAVRCPILAGWSSASPYEPSAPAERGTAYVLLGTLIAAGLFDVLRRLLK